MTIPPPLIIAQASGMVQPTAHAAAPGASNYATPLVVVPLPQPLILGQRIAITTACSWIAGNGATQVVPSINWCDSHGVYPVTYNDLPPNPDYNVAYWTDQAFTPGEQHIFSAGWSYDPRAGDINMEGYSGTYQNLGLHLSLPMPPNPSGATAVGGGAYLKLEIGSIITSYWYG